MFSLEFGKLSLAGGETIMSKEARLAVVLNGEAQRKFDECVAALTALRYGPEGQGCKGVLSPVWPKELCGRNVRRRDIS